MTGNLGCWRGQITAAQWCWHQTSGGTEWLQEQSVLWKSQPHLLPAGGLGRFQSCSSPAPPHVEGGVMAGTVERAAQAHPQEEGGGKYLAYLDVGGPNAEYQAVGGRGSNSRQV